MIEIDSQLSERSQMDMLELLYYLLRSENDGVAKAMEQVQAAAVGIAAVAESASATDEARLHSVSSAGSLLEAHKNLTVLAKTQESAINGLASYLLMKEVELFGTMEEWRVAQEVIKEMRESGELSST